MVTRGDAFWWRISSAFKILKLFLLKWISQWTKNNRENLDRNDNFWWQNGDKFWTKSVNNISQLSPSAFVKIEIVDEIDKVYSDIVDNLTKTAKSICDLHLNIVINMICLRRRSPTSMIFVLQQSWRLKIGDSLYLGDRIKVTFFGFCHQRISISVTNIDFWVNF